MVEDGQARAAAADVDWSLVTRIVDCLIPEDDPPIGVAGGRGGSAGLQCGSREPVVGGPTCSLPDSQRCGWNLVAASSTR